MTGDGPVENYTVQTWQAFDVSKWNNSTVTDLEIGDAAVAITVIALEVHFVIVHRDLYTDFMKMSYSYY